MGTDLILNDKAFEQYGLDMETMNRYRMPEEGGGQNAGAEETTRQERPEAVRRGGDAKKGSVEAKQHVHLSLPSELYAKAKMICAVRRVSLSSVICNLLKDYVTKELRKDPKLREFLGD